MGIGAMPETHPLSLRWLGMHGAVFANNAVNEADLVIALGARFDDRVTGAVNMFCPESTIVHIDIDASEINKNKKVAYPIRANVKDALRVLNSALAAKGWERKSSVYTRTPEWFGVIDGWKNSTPSPMRTAKGISPRRLSLRSSTARRRTRTPSSARGWASIRCLPLNSSNLTSPAVWPLPAVWEPWAMDFPPPWERAWLIRTDWL